MGGARQQDFAEARMPGANGMPGANARFRQRAAVRFIYIYCFCGYIFFFLRLKRASVSALRYALHIFFCGYIFLGGGPMRGSVSAMRYASGFQV